MSKVEDSIKKWLQENAESEVAYVYDDNPLFSYIKDSVKKWLQENAESGVAYIYDDNPLFSYIKEHQEQVSYSLAVDIYYHKDKNYFEVLLN